MIEIDDNTSQNRYFSVDEYLFLHDIVKAWFNARPEEVKKILIGVTWFSSI